MLKLKTTRDLGKICEEVRREMGHCPSPRFFLGGRVLMIGPLMFIKNGEGYALATEC